MSRWRHRAVQAFQVAWAVSVGVGLAGCAGQPAAPEWQTQARDASEAAQHAHLSRQTRVAALHWQRAAQAAARTAAPLAMARVALAQCATRLASLEVEPTACGQAAQWLADVSPAERNTPEARALQAYHRYLHAQPLTAAEAAALPEAHRPVALQLTAVSTPDAVAVDARSAAVVAAVADPLSRLVAASVVWRAQRGGPDVLAVAVDTASAQGWSRPLAVWLGLQAGWAEAAGQPAEAARLRRRQAWALGD